MQGKGAQRSPLHTDYPRFRMQTTCTRRALFQAHDHSNLAYDSLYIKAGKVAEVGTHDQLYVMSLRGWRDH